MLTVVTTPVVTVKVVDVLPEGTVMLAGTWAAGVLVLASVTTTPVVGAAPFNVTVPVDVAPPVSKVGFSATAETDGGLIVNVMLAVPP